jgi:hypothetical protein
MSVEFGRIPKGLMDNRGLSIRDLTLTSLRSRSTIFLLLNGTNPALAENLIRAGQALHMMTSTLSTHGWRYHGRMTGRAAATGLPRPDKHLRPLRLLPMTDQDKDIEILVLRHQIAVLQRQLGDTKVRFNSTDRALLAALLHRLPRQTLHKLRLLVRLDTILRWHRDLMRRRHAKMSRPKRPGRPASSDPCESWSSA